MMLEKAQDFDVAREMFEAADVIRGFNSSAVRPFAEQARKRKCLFLTGEGSSRMFPASHAAWLSMRDNRLPRVFTGGSTEALGFDLRDCAVFAASNSGKTKEPIRLFRKLREKGHTGLFAVTSAEGSPLTEEASGSYVLSCGMETAVAATKSLIEQALFYHALLFETSGLRLDGLKEAGDAFEAALKTKMPETMVRKTADAPFIYFAGWGSGVAEELSLKAGELLRKKTRYLEGTLLLHGIEEVMARGDLTVMIDPHEGDEELVMKRLVKDIGVEVIAVSHRQTMFTTVVIPEAKGFDCYVQMAAAWNLILGAGMLLSLDMDHPARVRKVGNY